MSNELKAKVALVLGVVLSLPVLKGVLDGTIPVASAAIRVAVGMALAYGAVTLVAAVVLGYMPKPVEPEPVEAALPDGVEEAVLVDEQPPADAP
jgi:Na+/H+ antiporter NhaC